MLGGQRRNDFVPDRVSPVVAFVVGFIVLNVNSEVLHRLAEGALRQVEEWPYHPMSADGGAMVKARDCRDSGAPRRSFEKRLDGIVGMMCGDDDIAAMPIADSSKCGVPASTGVGLDVLIVLDGPSRKRGAGVDVRELERNAERSRHLSAVLGVGVGLGPKMMMNVCADDAVAAEPGHARVQEYCGIETAAERDDASRLAEVCSDGLDQWPG
jgi:hypothetical protein